MPTAPAMREALSARLPATPKAQAAPGWRPAQYVAGVEQKHQGDI